MFVCMISSCIRAIKKSLVIITVQLIFNTLGSEVFVFFHNAIICDLDRVGIVVLLQKDH